MENQYGHEFCEGELDQPKKKLMETLMGKDYEDFFPKHPDDNQQHAKHLWDAIHPL